MSKSKTAVLICLAALLSAGISEAAIELQSVAQFTVPNLSGPIGQIRFADIDGDSAPEILASDGESLVLYSATLDSTLFQTRLDSAFLDLGDLEAWPHYYHIELGDVNRDSIADIVVGYYISAGDFMEPNKCCLVFYDGVNSYTDVDTVFLDTGDGYCTHWASRGLTALRAVDFDGDGYSELIVGWEKNFVSYGIDLEFTSGSTRMYHSFPDSVQWTIGKLLSLRSDVIREHDSSYIVTSRYKYHYSGMTTETSSDRTTAVMLYPDGRIWEAVQPDWPGSCSGSYAYSAYAVSTVPLCWGNMDTSSTETEMLVAYLWSRDCAYPDYSHTHDAESYLEMHTLSVHQPDIPLWVAGGVTAGAYVFIPEYPASYLRVTSGGLYQHNAASGALLDQTESVPPGWKFWSQPYGDGVTMLVAVHGVDVSLFNLDVRTAVDDPTRPPNLPASFTLGQPFPNPFNARLSIPIMMHRAGQTRVELFDLLGRRVEVLFDGVLKSGSHTLTWQADHAASGVYLIRATTADGSASAKATLLK